MGNNCCSIGTEPSYMTGGEDGMGISSSSIMRNRKRDSSLKELDDPLGRRLSKPKSDLFRDISVFLKDNVVKDLIYF